ncbi:MAG: S1 RNA-binding domain-containing protein [Pseudomonadales bacterium]|jgi:ribosomal protein S1|nr:S1 RNA-binding domain-containing protein [Pseudomonadales bacterium]
MATNTKTNAKTMEELLANNNCKIVTPKKDSIVEGVITAKTNKSVVVDVGAKTEGLIVDKEFDAAKEYIDTLEVGQKIEVLISAIDGNKGQILLSLRQAANKQKWDFFLKALETGEVFEVKGVETNKGGLIVAINGIRGFVPSSQFGKKYLGSLDKLRGATIKVKTIEVEQDKNRLIFSEKYVSEAKELEGRQSALEKVKVGDSYSGVVSGLMPFGLFVTVEIPIDDKGNLGLIEGLVHISEISWEKVSHPSQFYNLGDRVEVKAMELDPANEKLNLSIKQLTSDPWENVDEKYPVGTVISGTVSRIEPFGVFVNIEPGIDGLIHSSKLTGEEKELTKGESISINVESIEKDNKRMSLSLVSNELPVNYK